MLLVLIGRASRLAETALTRMNRVQAMALRRAGRPGSDRLRRLIEHPERTINPSCCSPCCCCRPRPPPSSRGARPALFGALGVVVATSFEGGASSSSSPRPRRRPGPSSTPRSGRCCAAAGRRALVALPPAPLADAGGLIGVSNVFLPGKGIKQGPFVSEEELLAMADAAAEDEVIEREERTLIHSHHRLRRHRRPRGHGAPHRHGGGRRRRPGSATWSRSSIARGFSRIPVFGRRHRRHRRRASTSRT